MSETSPLLSLPYLMPAQAQKHVTHNEALRRLDAIVQLAVLDRDRQEPPAAPAEGDRHIVAQGGYGDWAGRDGQVAVQDGGVWQFIAPGPGWRAEVLAEALAVVFDGSGWTVPVPVLENLDGVGIGTTSDAGNRLAVASDATLLTHAGGGHQVKVNKAASGDTASLLFQTGWSGRAEMGTAGTDDFTIKVSADGSSWRTAMRVNGATGAVGIGPDADALYQLSVVANSTEPTILVRNVGGDGGAAFRMIDDLSGGDWKFKTTNDGSFKLRDQSGGVDQLYLHKTTRCSEFAGAVRPQSYTVATLPAPASVGAGAMVYVSNAAGGGVPAFSDGSAWRRVTDRAVVS